MSRLVMVERSFAARRQAERWFQSIRRTTWPYVWCVRDRDSRRWNVTALVEHEHLPTVVPEAERPKCVVRSVRGCRHAA